MKFNEILKELRLENKWSQKTLANKLNVTDDCIYFWEKGRSEPSILQIIQIAKLFQVTTDYLLGVSEY